MIYAHDMLNKMVTYGHIGKGHLTHGCSLGSCPSK